MEYEHRITEMQRLGEANGGDPNAIDEDAYWQGFRSAWEAGFKEGFSEGRIKAMNDLNINIR